MCEGPVSGDGLVHGLRGKGGERVVLLLQPEHGFLEVDDALTEDEVLACLAMATRGSVPVE